MRTEQAGRKNKDMIGVCKRIALMLAIAAAASSPVWAGLSAEVTPTEATTNSIWNIRAAWDSNNEDKTPALIYVRGLGAPITLYDESWPEGTTDRYVDPEASAEKEGVTVYRVAVSRGLNMSRAQQQPKLQRDPDDADPTIPADEDNPLLLRDPRGNGILYAPALISDTRGNPIVRKFEVVAEFPAADPESDPPDPEVIELSVTVHGSNYGRSDYDGEEDTVETVLYNGNGGRDYLITYPGGSWPSLFYGPDPLTPVAPSSVVPLAIKPDDGSSSTAYEFRVSYWNDSNLPPKPWLPWGIDSFGVYNEQSTGVVLYLGLMNPLDPSGGYWYTPHFMRPEDPADTNYADGVDYIYRLLPKSTWGIGVGTEGQSPPAPAWYDNEYLSLLIGTYHYFFACSDDSLVFEDGTLLFTLKHWQTANPGKAQEWASAWGDGIASVDMGDPHGEQSIWSTGLDPYLPRGLVDPVTGADYMPRPEGRRYSAFGDDLWYTMDWQLYVDREVRVPGRFEGSYYFQYPHPATEHPEVSLALKGYGKTQSDGFGRFFGTVEPYYRCANAEISTDWSRVGLGQWGQRSETTGATTSTELTFKVKYYSRDNKPPVWIKTYINNEPYKVIDAEQPLTLTNGGYTGYTMQPASVQTSPGQSQVAPYNYVLGVDYVFKTQLPAGPHTYFFGAYDGKATAIFPNRPEQFTYNGTHYDDWWVPAYDASLGDPEGFDNNYIPGPYINNACELSSPSVTPATGVQGQNYTYRVLYKDADGQRPFQASVYIDTGVTTLGDNGIIRVDMYKEDPAASDYKQGVWYVSDTATLENFSMAKGVRHYRFEFIDDWGRQSDPNDIVRGETTKSPASGGWINGPTIGQNYRPTLRGGSVESTDGAANGATLWKFSVNYKDLNNDAPSFVTLYTGELLSDGETIKWDSGQNMVKADPSDNTYSDGCQYIVQTRLRGAQNTGDAAITYYYAFEASDGYSSELGSGENARVVTNLAKWVPSDYPDTNAISEWAGCMLDDDLTTTDNIVYSSSKTPIVGRLFELPVSPNVLIDPIVWRYPGGDLTAPEIVSRANDPDVADDYYLVKGESLGTRLNDGVREFVVTRYDAVDPAYLPVIDEVLGVFLTQDMSGTNYFLDADENPGTYNTDTGDIVLGQDLPFGTDWVWIKYRNTTGYTLNRWTGEFTFPEAQSSEDVFKADYFFANQLSTSVGVNKPPTLSSPKLTPLAGTSGSTFTYSVVYKETEGVNGQPPTFVRVVIDGVARNMTPVAVGTPSYRSGVTYRYATTLTAGSHNYYFETSDGVGIVTLPAVNTGTGKISPYLGPWINDRPTLTAGIANPNPTDDTISAAEPVTYSVLYRDLDNDAPIVYYPFADDLEAADSIKSLAMATPLLYVDNDTSAMTVGSVEELVPDSIETTKYRSIKVLDKNGEAPDFVADAFAGKLIQFTSGVLTGQVYLIVNNSTDTLNLLTEDLNADGIEVGDTFSIAVMQMFKADPSQQNYATGVTYQLSVPQLAEGEHSFHFRAASVLTPPDWLKALDSTYADVTQSVWVRFPVSGELNGPNVAIEAPDTNRAPILSMQAGDSPVSPASGKTSDVYDFFVTYKDDDGDPPRYHDNTLGYVRIVFDDGKYAGEMRPEVAEDTSDPLFYTTARRFIVRTTGLPEGPHKFHFEASDGWSKVRWPAVVDISDPTADDPEVTVNYKGRIADITVSPSSGNTTTTFAITAKYSDPDGFAPMVEGAKEQVWVEIGSSATKVYLTRSASDTNFAGGVVYSGSKTGLAVGTYPTVFKAKDNVGEETSVNGPTIRVSNNLAAPAVSNPKVYNLSRPSEVNADATGGSTDTFRYEVTYTDSDGDVPLVEQTDGSWVEGIELYIDGVLEGIMTQKVGTEDPDYEAGVTFYYQKAGRTYQAGQHNHQFKANDGMPGGSHAVQTSVTQGPTIISATINFTVQSLDSQTSLWELRDPLIGETMRVSGALVESDLKPITGGQKITITVARPDGTSETFAVTGSSDNEFSFDRIPTINRIWTITARWAGNADYKTAVAKDLKVDVKGPTRVIATQDMSQPVSSAPAIDMVGMPLTAPNGDVGTLFGFDRVRSMQIIKWDPVERTYLRYGDNYFSPLGAGAAMWVYPSALYPDEAVDPDNPPSAADSDYPVSASQRYRLYKPFGRLFDPSTQCEIVVKTGWNQFGSPYLSPVQFSGINVVYQGQTMTIAQAAQNGWIRDYAWMWHPTSQSYKLIHASRPDAFARTLDTWRGHWIRSFVDCVLVLPAPGVSASSASASASRASTSQEEVGAMDFSSLATLDEPPPAPNIGRGQ